MEIKILDIDIKPLEERLVSMGAKKVFDGQRIITYFSNEKDKKPFLKLTEEDGKLKLTSKNYADGEDVKLFVSRKEECLELLRTLGYFRISEVNARRISFELETIDFDIDIFSGFPPFLEIDLGKNSPISLKELLLKLDIENNRTVEISTPEIISYYGKDYFKIYEKRN